MPIKSLFLTLSLLLSFNSFADYTDLDDKQCGKEVMFELKNLIKIDPKRYITETNNYEFPSKMGPYNVEVFIEECHEDIAWFADAFKVLDDQGNIIFERDNYSGNLQEVVPEADFPFYILRDHSGGMHCCYTTYYFSKSKPYSYMGTLNSRDVKPSYEDIDGDGNAELIEYDANLTYWYTSFAGSRFIKVIYRAFEDAFHPAPDLILQDMDYQDVETALEQMRDVIKGHDDKAEERKEWAKYKDDKILHDIGAFTAQFLYAGMKEEAWEFYDRIWAEQEFGFFRKMSFKRELEAQIMKSQQYNSIHARSVVLDNLPKITSLSKECVYMREEGWGKDKDSEARFTDINLRELHNDECGGDPETDVTIGYYRVYEDGKVEEFDYLDWQLRNLE